jgi:hypothetical protein
VKTIETATKNDIEDNEDKVENNRYNAKLILASKQTSGLLKNFGISWFKVLEPEFSKPYFLKVGLETL